eukprot:18775-Prymnesium_polylepis.1
MNAFARSVSSRLTKHDGSELVNCGSAVHMGRSPDLSAGGIGADERMSRVRALRGFVSWQDCSA